jgi:hypothetical protein
VPKFAEGQIMTNRPNARLAIAVLTLACMAAASVARAQTYGIDMRNTLMPASGGMAGTSVAAPQDFISAIKDEAKARLKAGKEVPGWTLIQKKGAVRTDSKALKIRWSELTSEPIPTVTGEPSLMLKKSNP